MRSGFFKRTGCALTAALMIACCAPQVTDSLPLGTIITAQAKSPVIELDVKDGSDIGAILNGTLSEASQQAAENGTTVTVKVPAGTYTLGQTLHMFSNTTLDVTGCTLKSDNTFHNLLILATNGTYKGINEFNSSSAAKGYTSCENVKIKGGTWVGSNKNNATLFRLAHAKNVTLEGMTITGGNYSSHQVETAAINGLYIRNCTFKDYKPINYLGKGHYECIQIDIPCSSKTYKSCYLDGTPTKNVEITGCKFTNVSRGLGTHSMLVGAYHSNIKITDNTFTNLQEEAIIALNYINCTIARNKIVNAGGGILFENAKFADTGSKIVSMYTTVFDGKKAGGGKIINNVNSTISDNTMTIVYSKDCDRIQGIRVHGLNVDKAYKGGDNKTIPKKNYYISGVTVKNNKITTAGYGIFIDDARDSTIANNTITQKAVSKKDSYKNKYDGIFVSSGCKRIAIDKNKISGFRRNGIFVMTGSGASRIKGNKISSCKKDGICLYDKASGGNISSNTIKKCGEEGILLNSKCKVSKIANNTISGHKDTGIYINARSTVTGAIKGNTITDCKDCGIILNNGSMAGSITSNTISGHKGTGIYLNAKSVVSGAVKGNAISGCKDCAVILNNSSKAGSITGNKISKTGKYGIYVTCSKITKTVDKNSIKKVDYGINITNKSRVGKGLKGNKFSGISEKKIRVSDDSYGKVS